MKAERSGGFRGFLRTKPGRVVLVLLSVGIVFATYAFISDGTILAIPVFILIGFAFPVVYAGVKRPRFLALSGLVVLLVVAPLATIVYSQELLVPPSPASTAGAAPDEVGGSVLQNASVGPFSGSASTVFTWQVSLYPKFLNSSFDHTNWSNDSVQLFVSSCPGATSTNLSYCGGPYTLLVDWHNFTSEPADGSVVTFHGRVTGNGIWSWQMELVLQNTSSASNPYRFELVGDPTYDALEGPIVGGFPVVYGALIGTIYEVELIYLGIPFYFVLLLYMWFKGREARHKEAVRRGLAAKAASAGTVPAGTLQPVAGAPGAEPAGTKPGPSSGPGASELACPSCGAVVYPNETKCWKCGATLGSPSSSAPLPSKPN